MVDSSFAKWRGTARNYQHPSKFGLCADSKHAAMPVYRLSAMFAKIFVPAGLRRRVTAFAYSGPVRHVWHLGRLTVGLRKKVIEHIVGDIAGASIAPVASNLILRSRCFSEL
jgi:hypothetical protein